MLGLLLAAAARAQSPPVSIQMLSKEGHQIGPSEKTTPVKVTARVLDAQTGQPLTAFEMTPGALDRDWRSFDWEEKNRQVAPGAEASITLYKAKLPPALLIEAPGYLPQGSGPIYGLETNITFMLQKGSGPAGVVLTPDGSPAAGRTVYLSGSRDLLVLEGTNLTPRTLSSRLRSAKTDSAGRFSFAPSLDDFGVMVVDDAGFAEVRVEALKASPQVRLQPWARVEGTLKIGSQPGSSQMVRLVSAFAEFAYYPRPMPPCSISASNKTDAEGRFVFPRVPPTDVKLAYVPQAGKAGSDEVPITQITNITLKPGETRDVTIGGQGRPVVGRVVLKNYDKALWWPDEVSWLSSLSPEPPDCPNFQATDSQYHLERRAAANQAEADAARSHYIAAYDRVARQLCAYYNTPAGRAYWFSRRSFVLQFAQDGSFRAEDVPAGKYDLTIDLRELDTQAGALRAPRIALHREQIEVPDSPGGRSDTPLDLGVIKIGAPLIQGALAPDFQVSTVDDKTIKLSDYRGKYVLLDFWAAGNTQSVQAMPDLKETFASYKDNPAFAMIGLDMDPDISAARDFSVRHRMGWTQGYLGRGDKAELADRFGAESLPYIILLDKRGRVAAAGLQGGNIKSAVDAALASE